MKSFFVRRKWSGRGGVLDLNQRQKTRLRSKNQGKREHGMMRDEVAH
jgi:hypothetical protein